MSIMQINGLVLHIYFFTNLYNQLKFIHFDNVILCYFFSLMKPINIFRLLHVWLIDIKSVRIIHSFLFIFSLKQSDATFIGYAHLITSMRRDHCTVYVLINVCGQMSSIKSLCVFVIVFCCCLFDYIYFVADHLDTNKCMLGSYNKPV